MVGKLLGNSDGYCDREFVSIIVGVCVLSGNNGLFVGFDVGEFDGIFVGFKDGREVRSILGLIDGFDVGILVQLLDGIVDGECVLPGNKGR